MSTENIMQLLNEMSEEDRKTAREILHESHVTSLKRKAVVISLEGTFLVGDRVKIKSNSSVAKKFWGREATVTKVTDLHLYCTCPDASKQLWPFLSEVDKI